MSDVGQAEKPDQDAVISLFRDTLGYRYLGDLRHGDNRNIRENDLRGWLNTSGQRPLGSRHKQGRGRVGEDLPHRVGR